MHVNSLLTACRIASTNPLNHLCGSQAFRNLKFKALCKCKRSARYLNRAFTMIGRHKCHEFVFSRVHANCHVCCGIFFLKLQIMNVVKTLWQMSTTQYQHNFHSNLLLCHEKHVVLPNYRGWARTFGQHVCKGYEHAMLTFDSNVMHDDSKWYLTHQRLQQSRNVGKRCVWFPNNPA